MLGEGGEGCLGFCVCGGGFCGFVFLFFFFTALILFLRMSNFVS